MQSLMSKPSQDIPRLLLRAEFERRLQSNPRYSLRRFAEQLEIDSSLLSKIIQGKRKISSEMARKIIQNGNLSEDEKEVFVSRYMLAHLGQDSMNTKPSKTAKNTISQVLFAVISDPVHYVILELLTIERYRSDLELMARAIDRSVAEVQSCLRKLRTVGLVEGSHRDWKRASGRNLIADPKTTGPALKASHQKILEKSVVAMNEVPIELRSHLWMTLPVNPAKIPVAKALLEEFRDRLTDTLETGETESVYHLVFNLFPAHRISS